MPMHRPGSPGTESLAKCSRCEKRLASPFVLRKPGLGVIPQKAQCTGTSKFKLAEQESLPARICSPFPPTAGMGEPRTNPSQVFSALECGDGGTRRRNELEGGTGKSRHRGKLPPVSLPSYVVPPPPLLGIHPQVSYSRQHREA